VILASVGTQLPFDRLIKTIDDWAEQRQRTDVIAQIGPARYVPRAIRYFPFLEHDEFHKLQLSCSIMVSHAGMGSIITALELGKPIIILARDHHRKEHRNGHQIDTLGQFRNYPGVYAARDEDHVVELLDQSETLSSQPALTSSAPVEFINRLSEYIQQPREPSLMSRLFGRSEKA
jgi:UDP-N-acetylglucosamine transferase subunit ALG13